MTPIEEAQMVYVHGRMSPPTQAAVAKARRLLHEISAAGFLNKADVCRHMPELAEGYRAKAAEELEKAAVIAAGGRFKRRMELLAKAEACPDPQQARGILAMADRYLEPEADEPDEGDQADADEMIAKADAAQRRGDHGLANDYRAKAADFLAGRG